VLHIYRDKEHEGYKFKNGKYLFCPYWKHKKTNANNQRNICKKVLVANHMTYYGNLLLTKDIVEIIGDELRFNNE
jgi:hypothetical protein